MGPKLSRDANITEDSKNKQNINSSEQGQNFIGRNEGHRTSLTKFQSSTVKVDEAISAAETEALVIKQKYNKQSDDKDLIEQCLLQNFFMKALDSQARMEIIKKMSLAYVAKDTVIFKQGNSGSYY